MYVQVGWSVFRYLLLRDECFLKVGVINQMRMFVVLFFFLDFCLCDDSLLWLQFGSGFTKMATVTLRINCVLVSFVYLICLINLGTILSRYDNIPKVTYYMENLSTSFGLFHGENLNFIMMLNREMAFNFTSVFFLF